MQRDYIRCRDFTLCKSDTTLCDSALRRAVLHKVKTLQEAGMKSAINEFNEDCHPYSFFDHRQVFIDHRLTQIGTDYEPKALIRMIIDY